MLPQNCPQHLWNKYNNADVKLPMLVIRTNQKTAALSVCVDFMSQQVFRMSKNENVEHTVPEQVLHRQGV